MTLEEYLASEELKQKVRKARGVMRVAGGTGKITVVLDLKDDIFRSGGVDLSISSGRIDAKAFKPE